MVAPLWLRVTVSQVPRGHGPTGITIRPGGVRFLFVEHQKANGQLKGKQQAITAAQCRAARGLIEMSQLDLARAAVLTSSIVIDFENGASTPQRANLDAMRHALESAGVEFIPENGGGAGVRLRKGGK